MGPEVSITDRDFASIHVYLQKKSTVTHPSQQFPPAANQKICSLLTPSPCLSSLLKAVLDFYPQPRPIPWPWCQELQDTASQPVPFCASTFCCSCCSYSPKDLPFKLFTTDLPLTGSQPAKRGHNQALFFSTKQSCGLLVNPFSFLPKAGLTVSSQGLQGFTSRWG